MWLKRCFYYFYLLLVPPLAGVWRSRLIAGCGVSDCLPARGGDKKILMGHSELLEVLYSSDDLDPVAIPLVGHDWDREAVPLRA